MSFLDRLQFEICLGLVSPNWMHFLSLQCHFCLIYWAKKQDIIALMTFYLFKSLLNNWVSLSSIERLEKYEMENSLRAHQIGDKLSLWHHNGTRRDSRSQDSQHLHHNHVFWIFTRQSFECSTAKKILRHINNFMWLKA